MPIRGRITPEIEALYAKLESVNVRPRLENKVDLTLFHGTSPECASVIVRKRHMERSHEERLLGGGFYFYEDAGSQRFAAVEMARAHAKFRKKYSSQAVVGAAVSAHRTFDLTLRQNKRYLQFVFDWFVDTVKKTGGDVGEVDVPIVVRFILMSCPQRDLIQAVRWDGFWLPEIGARSQYGYLIRDWKCVKKLWLHVDD